MRPRNPVFDLDILNAGLLMFAVISVIIVGYALLKLLRRAYLGPDESSVDILESLRAAHLYGTLDDAEFQRVTESLARPVNLQNKISPPEEFLPGE